MNDFSRLDISKTIIVFIGTTSIILPLSSVSYYHHNTIPCHITSFQDIIPRPILRLWYAKHRKITLSFVRLRTLRYMSVLDGVGAVHLRPPQNVLNAAVRIILRKAKVRSHHCRHSWPSALVATSAEDWVQDVCSRLQVSTSDSTNLSLWAVHLGRHIRQPEASPFGCTMQPRHLLL